MRLLGDVNIIPTLGLTQKKRGYYTPDPLSIPWKLDTGSMKRVKNISSFISIPCSFIYGVLGVRMLPFHNREPNKQERVNGS